MENNEIQKSNSSGFSAHSGSIQRSLRLIEEVKGKTPSNEKTYEKNLHFQIIKSVPRNKSTTDLAIERCTELSKRFMDRIEYLEPQARDRKWIFFTPFLSQVTKEGWLIPDLANHGFWYTNDIYLKQIIINMDMGSSVLTYWPESVYNSKKNLELTISELVEFVFRVHEEMIEGKNINVDNENKGEEFLATCLENQLKNYVLCQKNLESTATLLSTRNSSCFNVEISRKNVRNNTCNKGVKLIEKLILEGIQIFDVEMEDTGEILLEHYVEKWVFSIQEISPRGGQIFVCPTKFDGDKIFDYYDSLASLAGPHLYRSSCGRVIAQLNKDLSKKTGDLFREFLLGLKLP
jgi:hypothetical protein